MLNPEDLQLKVRPVRRHGCQVILIMGTVGFCWRQGVQAGTVKKGVIAACEICELLISSALFVLVDLLRRPRWKEANRNQLRVSHDAIRSCFSALGDKHHEYGSMEFCEAEEKVWLV